MLFFVGINGYSQSLASQKKDYKTVKYKNIEKPFSEKEMKWLQEVYVDKLQKLVLNNPQRVKDIKHLLRNRVEIKKIENPNNVKGVTLLSKVPLFSNYNKHLKRDVKFLPETFNPLKYTMDFYTKGEHTYRVDNTSYYIIIRSQFR